MAKNKWKSGSPPILAIGAAEGERVHLVSAGMLRHECSACQAGQESLNNDNHSGVFFMMEDLALFCPTCGSKNIKKCWTRPMTVLVPEEEASFMARRITPES